MLSLIGSWQYEYNDKRSGRVPLYLLMLQLRTLFVAFFALRKKKAREGGGEMTLVYKDGKVMDKPLDDPPRAPSVILVLVSLVPPEGP